MKRAIILVIDGGGAGEAPDAAAYSDAGASTLVHVAQADGKLRVPTLAALGLGNLLKLKNVPPAAAPAGAWTILQEVSAGKDSITGHWELAGLVTEKPFPTYPKGFPPEVIEPFQREIGREILGNCVASGTEIIKSLGVEHIKTGSPIVYTSADSVFQIAAHEEVIPVEELYQICETARRLLVLPHNVSRVIARPFAGKPGNFMRTANRKDFSVPPHGKTLLDLATEKGLKTVGIGKIGDLFSYHGLSEVIHTESDEDGLRKTHQALDDTAASILFTNLVDFDMKFGHRNDVAGFARNLEMMDRWLVKILGKLQKEDLLFITADHGCDPTITTSTDHTREWVPLLVVGAPVRQRKFLGRRSSFADVGQSCAEYLGLTPTSAGTSFLREIL